MPGKKWLFLIMMIYLALAISYALATPPLESSDEYKHYPVVQYVQTRYRLPVLDAKEPGKWLQEAAQPPLYYLLMAGLTSSIDTGDLEDLYQKNPHVFIGNTRQVTNKNLIVHDLERESFPWRGSILAIYLIRFASIVLGIGTVMVTALVGKTLFSDRVGLFAAALTAFNPMFLFVSAAVNNDSLAILLGHLGLFLLIKIWQDNPDPFSKWHRYMILGIVLGLGILTKLSLGGLLGLTGLALAWLSWKKRDIRPLVIGGGIVVVTAVIISGWWFLRNLRVYGDLTGLEVFIAVQGTRETTITWANWVGEFGTFFRSYWGLFGGVNIATPEAFYQVCNLAFLVGVSGWIATRVKGEMGRSRGTGLAIGWILILLALLIRWNLISPAFQGRLIFPALGALNALWAVGMIQLTGKNRRPILALVVIGWLLGSAVLIPWKTIRPAYRAPTPLSTIPAEASFGPISFDDNTGEIQLVGVEIEPDQTVTPAGEPVELALYWKAIEPVDKDYVSAVHLLGRNSTSVGQINRYPGWGMVPTSKWQSGEIWRDVYLVTVATNAKAPTRLRVSVGLFDTATHQTMPARDPEGALLDLVLVGEAKLRAGAGDQPAQPNTTLKAFWDDNISLTGFDLDAESMEIALYWNALGSPTTDYTVFVHLLDQDGGLVGQADGPPLNGDYPTSWWARDDVIVDIHRILLDPETPAGIYRLSIGLYRPSDGSRLSVQDENGAPLPGQKIDLPEKLKVE